MPASSYSPRSSLNPCELKIDLCCKGLRVDSSLTNRSNPQSQLRRGNGLEIILPGSVKDVFANVPVVETFAQQSPYALMDEDGRHLIKDDRDGRDYPVRMRPLPEWYKKSTSQGVPMGRVGLLRGNLLGAYVGPACRYWSVEPAENCKYCTTGLHLKDGDEPANVGDVVETCLAAQRESSLSSVLLYSGYQGGQEFQLLRSLVETLIEETDLAVGLQLSPLEAFSQYDELIDMGVQTFSFCFGFYDAEAFFEFCPGKTRTLGLAAFMEAIDYTARRLGKGRVSVEIIAGVEPLKSTLFAIDQVTDSGAVPAISIFRPLQGSQMQNFPPPDYEFMRAIAQHLIKSCIFKRIPFGLIPGDDSQTVQPADALYLAPRDLPYYRYRMANWFLLQTPLRPSASGLFRRSHSTT